SSYPVLPFPSAVVARTLKRTAFVTACKFVQVVLRYVFQVDAQLPGQHGDVPEAVPNLGGDVGALFTGEIPRTTNIVPVSDQLLNDACDLALLGRQPQAQVGQRLLEVLAGVDSRLLGRL